MVVFAIVRMLSHSEDARLMADLDQKPYLILNHIGSVQAGTLAAGFLLLLVLTSSFSAS